MNGAGAQEAGVSEAALDDAMDSDEPKAAIIQLLL